MKTIPVPADLPPTAALALWEWLADLEQAVWTHYVPLSHTDHPKQAV